MRRKKKKIKKSNKEFLVIMYLFLAVFLSMMIYFVYFQVCKSESFINSPYNSLQDLFSDHVIRGDIVSADSKVLATTKVSADGTQTRSYPQGRMFAHAVGYAVNEKRDWKTRKIFLCCVPMSFSLRESQMIFQIRRHRGIRLSRRWMHRFSRWHTNLLEIIREL